MATNHRAGGAGAAGAAGRAARRGAAQALREPGPDLPRSLTSADYDSAKRRLMRRDPVLGAAIVRIGPCRLADRQRQDHLTALITAVVNQQLSGKAAATILGRLLALFP